MGGSDGAASGDRADREEREVLERWARRPKSTQVRALRCRIGLAASAGENTIDIALDWGAAGGR